MLRFALVLIFASGFALHANAYIRPPSPAWYSEPKATLDGGEKLALERIYTNCVKEAEDLVAQDSPDTKYLLEYDDGTRKDVTKEEFVKAHALNCINASPALQRIFPRTPGLPSGPGISQPTTADAPS
jgi:hypothetical protein